MHAFPARQPSGYLQLARNSFNTAEEPRPVKVAASWSCETPASGFSDTPIRMLFVAATVASQSFRWGLVNA